MTQAGKWITLIFLIALVGLLVLHPAATAGEMAVGGSVLNDTIDSLNASGTPSKGGTVAYGKTTVNFSN
jgi:hypothetical protein